MRTSTLIALTLAKRRMTAPLVVEHLDVVEQLHLRVAEAFEAIGALALTVEKKLSMTALS
jgi:hypothetical protein